MSIVIPAELDSSAFEAGLSEMEQRAKETGEAVQDVLDQKITRGAKNAAKGVGGLNAVTGNLRSQFIDIGVGLQGGQNPLTILSQQGPQIAEAFLNAKEAIAKMGAEGAKATELLTARLVSMGLAFGGIALAAGAVLLVLRDLKSDVKALEKQIDTNADALERMQDALQGIQDVGTSLDIRELKLVDPSAARSLEGATQAAKKFAPAVQSVNDQMDAEQAKLSQAETEVRKWERALGSATEQQISASIELQRNKANLDRAKSSVKDSTAQISAYKEQLHGLNEAQGELAGRIVKVLNAEAGEKQAKKDAAQAARDAAAARREENASIKEAVFLLGVQDAINRISASTAKDEIAQMNAMADAMGLVKDAVDDLATDREWAALARSTSNFVEPTTLGKIRELSAAVDDLAPSKDTITRTDRLKLLLLDLQLAAAEDARAADALAEPIKRVEKALRKARADALLADLKKVSDAVGKIGEKIGSAIGGAFGAVSSMMGKFGGSIGDLLGNASSGDVSDAAAQAKDAIKALPGVIAATAKQAPKILDALIAEIPQVIKSIGKYLPRLAIRFAGMAIVLVDTLIGLLPKLLVRLIGFIPKLVTMIATALPGLLSKLLAALVPVLNALIAILPEVIYTLVGLIPQLILAVIQAIPDLLPPLVTLIPTIAIALIGAIVTKLLPQLPKIVFELIKALIQSIGTVAKALWAALLDALGAHKRADKVRESLANDAPGMQRMGPQGGRVDLGAGDYYLAGRNPQALLDQALRGLSTAPQTQAAPAMGGQVNLAWQHRAFDGFFVRHAAIGGQTTNLFKTFQNADARGLR